jgi:hypothetical protein
MAVLTAQQLVEIRKKVAAKHLEVPWTKPTINAALQGIEDWFEGNKGNLSTAINTASSPFVFTAAQKKFLIAYWLFQKARREGI